MADMPNRSRRALALVVTAVLAGLGRPAAADPPVVIGGDTTWESAPGAVLFTDPAGARVGIGTTEPQAVLHIAREYDASLAADGYSGAIRITSPSAEGENRLLIDSNEILAMRYVDQQTSVPHVALQTLHLQHQGGGVLINGGLGSSHRVHFTGAGAVHIGEPNATPAATGARLSVAGTIVAEELVVTPDGWADDVFAPGYEMRSIAELERFVRHHRHLPGIPSEREVMDDGLSVAEFNANLLRTVEELTLRVVDQSKQLEAQRQEHAGALARQRSDYDARLARLEATIAELSAQR